jgi:hypothetical protein
MANYMGHEIFNNTCYNSRIGIHFYVSSTTQKTGNISVKNNLIIRSSQHHVLIEKGVEGPFEFSNNLYSSDGEGRFSWKGSALRFSEWRTLTGLDANSLLADPQLASLAPNAPRDFTLSAQSISL